MWVIRLTPSDSPFTLQVAPDMAWLGWLEPKAATRCWSLRILSVCNVTDVDTQSSI